MSPGARNALARKCEMLTSIHKAKDWRVSMTLGESYVELYGCKSDPRLGQTTVRYFLDENFDPRREVEWERARFGVEENTARTALLCHNAPCTGRAYSWRGARGLCIDCARSAGWLNI